MKHKTRIIVHEPTGPVSQQIENEALGCLGTPDRAHSAPGTSDIEQVASPWLWTDIAQFTGLEVTMRAPLWRYPLASRLMCHIDKLKSFKKGEAPILRTRLEASQGKDPPETVT